MENRPRIIVITGASSGIGRQLASRAAENGDHPVLIARSESILREIQKEQQQKGRQCSVYPADISDESSCRRAVDMIIADLDLPDVLINNAGTGVFAPVEDISPEEAAEMLHVNLFGTFLVTKYFLPYMKQRQRGMIINIGSQAGKVATPKASVYAAVKHGVIGFSNSLRLEARDYGVQVTVVNTGPVRTPFIQKADRSGDYENKAGRWMLNAEKVSRRIYKLTIHPRRELNLPWWMAAVSRLYPFMPAFIEKAGKRWFQKK
ncbi:SDR family NAD(P)-dependent oxidoreductase [Salibacterium sp. K-3]